MGPARQVPSNGNSAGASDVAGGASEVAEVLARPSGDPVVDAESSEPQPTSRIQVAATLTAADLHRR
jgi:hypothetical protein